MAEKQSIKNQSVEKLFQIIETMAQSPVPMRLYDIAASVGMPTSTTLRFVNTLDALGYVHQDPFSHRYALTLKFTAIGEQIASQISIRDIARPFLIDLSKRFEETCCLGEEQNLDVVYLDIVNNPNNHIRLSFIQRPGTHAPMHCTGIGKLLLLNKTNAEIDTYIQIKKIGVNKNRMVYSYPTLVAELEKTRKRGYSIDDEETVPGVRSVAVPIHDYSGKVIYGISLAGPSSRLNSMKIEQMVLPMLEASSQISRILGTSD